jgi:hypothetical protein
LRFGTTSLNSENPFNAGSITLLAPDIVEAILDGRQPAAITLAALMRPFAMGVEWAERSQLFFRTGRGLGASPIPGLMANEAPAVLPAS